MADETKIQWCDSTINPIMGCVGCELFPPPLKVIQAIKDALVDAGVTRGQTRAKADFLALINKHYERIEAQGQATPHHHNELTTTNLWHLREEFQELIDERHGMEAAAAARRAIERTITCYAGIDHCNKGCSLLPRKKDGQPKEVNDGFAPTFEEITQFPGRMSEAAHWSDLLGARCEDRPWTDGLPRLVFVSDMGDAFSRDEDFDFLEKDALPAIQSEAGRRHLWLWLTKQPKRMVKFAERVGGFPENVCAMTTVTGRDKLFRLDDLRRVDAKVRGLSLEPLWEAIPPEEVDLGGVDWVIVGGESSDNWQNAHRFDVEWAEAWRDHCRENGVAFFLKQLGSRPFHNGQKLDFDDGHGGDWDEWEDEALKVREFPEYFHDYRSGEKPWPQAVALRREPQMKLTKQEKDEFTRLNRIVVKAAKGFVEIADALYRIREGKLYRAKKFKTFEEYCRTMLQISRTYAFNLIRAGRIRAELFSIENTDELLLPANEAQFRELAQLPTQEVRVEVLKEAKARVVELGEEAEGRPDRAASVLREVVGERRARLMEDRPVRKSPSQRIKEALQLLDEVETAFDGGQGAKKKLAALRRVLEE